MAMASGRDIVVTAAALLIAAAWGQAFSQERWREIYSCGPSAGHSYFFNGQGWSDDGISKGTIVLRRRGTDFDVQVGDATGGYFSATEDGAMVIVREDEGALQVLVFYPRATIETYLFSRPANGRTTLAWTSSKRSGIADRASVFISSCTVRGS